MINDFVFPFRHVMSISIGHVSPPRYLPDDFTMQLGGQFEHEIYLMPGNDLLNDMNPMMIMT